MTEVLLFHHAQGQTTGFHAFADELVAPATRCTLPTSSTAALSTASTKAWHLSGSSASARSSTAASVRQTNCPTSSSTPVSRSAWCRRRSSLKPVRAREVLLFYSCVPVSEFGPWPAGVPAQIHGMDADPLFVDEGDIDAAVSSSSPRRTPSCSSTPAISTISPIPACPRTIRTQLPCSPDAYSTSSTGLIELRQTTRLRARGSGVSPSEPCEGSVSPACGSVRRAV